METDLIVNHGEWIVMFGLVVIIGMFSLYQYHGVLQRRRHLWKRTCCNEDEWFDKYFPVDPCARELARRILTGLADDIGVNWTQFRPSDTFEAVLRVQGRYSPLDDLEDAEMTLAAIADERGIKPESLPAFRGSLKEFIDRTLAVLTASDQVQTASGVGQRR